MVLECSSKGDKRFSAYYAYVEAFGEYASIEQHYQACKRAADGSHLKKGQCPDYIILNQSMLGKEFLTPWYKLLWVKYLDQHPELVAYAKTFEDFHDMFKGHHTVNCQADVIRQYVKQGRSSIMQEPLVQDLLVVLRRK